jgi:hypothetical protein
MIGMNAQTGKPISDLDHIRQSIFDILLTPLGTRIERREYGSLLPELIDAPINARTHVQLYAASATALMRWEPRVRLTRVYTEKIDGAELTLVVEGTRSDGRAINASFPIGRQV